MQEIMEEVDLDQFVNQPVPDDPEKLRLSLIFSKDLITTLQQDIADLHHRLQIADTEYDGTHDIDDEEDDIVAGVHVTNATLTKMDGGTSAAEADAEAEAETDLYGQRYEEYNNVEHKPNIYDLGSDDDNEEEDAADVALNKKETEHEKFFSTYNILSKQVNTQQTLIQAMGSYQALMHLSDNAVTFSEIVANLQMKLKTAKDAFNIVRDALDGIGIDLDINTEDIASLSDDDDDDLEKKLFISNAREILRESQKLVKTIDSTIDELNGAKHLIHPDQKKIFSLQSRIKEFQVALPLHKIKKLAILNALPSFIKQELSDVKIQKQTQEARELQRLRELRGHKKKATRTLVDDDIADYDEDIDDKDEEEDKDHDEEQLDQNRIESFDSTMDAVSTCMERLQSRLNNINDSISAMEGDLETMEDPSAELLVTSIGDIRDEMKTCEDAAHDIVTYFVRAKEFVHPTQNVLITAINEYVEQSIENDALQKQMDMLQEELNAKTEQINALKKERSMTIDENIDEERETQEFVNHVVEQLRELRDKSMSIHYTLKQSNESAYYDEDHNESDLKNKTSLAYDEIKQMDIELNGLRETLDDLSAQLMHDDHCILNITPRNEYISVLESRYINVKKLYRLKFDELETLKDCVIYNESLIETKNEEIEELEFRLVRIMTSASTAAETRMEAINTMNQKSQTYRSVMDLIDDNVRLSSSALRNIAKLVKTNRNDNDLNATDAKEMLNYCKTIKKGLESVHAEMSGARNFVHPDREMVYALQQQILENRNRERMEMGTSNDRMDEANDEKIEDNKRGVHFKSKTSNVSRSASTSGYDRRTKSVHEIAWSKFDAGHEVNMEDLEKKEREVLEDEIKNEILNEIKAEYDDRFDKEVATMRAQLQQDIREQIRLEYEDLEATYNTEIDTEQIKMELEEQYDSRLEAERNKIDEYYSNKIESELETLKENNSTLQTECDVKQNRIREIYDSKVKLITSTSSEIDALRCKIKMYMHH